MNMAINVIIAVWVVRNSPKIMTISVEAILVDLM